MKKFLKDYSWLTISHLTSTVLGLITAVAFANFLPKPAYGIYKYVFSLSGIFSAFSLTGLTTAIVQSVARGYEGILRASFWHGLKWSWPTVLLSLGAAFYYLIQGNYLLSLALFFVAILTPLINSAALTSSFLNGKEEFAALLYYQLFRNGINTAVIVGSLFLTKNPLFLVIIYLAIQLITGLLAYRYTLNKYQPNDRVDQRSFNLGKHLSIIGAFTSIINNLDSALIFHFLGATSVATYAIASAFPDKLIGLFRGFHTLALPKYSQTKEVKIRSIFNNSLLLFALGFFIFLVYAILAYFLFSILFPKYLEAVNYSILIGLNLPLAALNILPGAVIESRLEVKIKYLTHTTTHLTRLLLMIILIVPLGIYGVIISELISRTVTFIFTYSLLKKL